MSKKAAENVFVHRDDVGSQMPGGVPPNAVWLANCLYDIQLAGSDTDGGMSLTDLLSGPHNMIAPPHQHRESDELIFVLYGELFVYVYTEDRPREDDAGLDPEKFVMHQLRTGDFIWMPRHTVEALFTRDSHVRALFIFTPAGGSDEFFAEAGDKAQHMGVPATGEYDMPTVEHLRTLSDRAGFQDIPESLEVSHLREQEKQ